MLQRLKQIRERLGYNQKEFGAKLGMPQSTYNDMERGKTPISNRTLITVCAVFCVNENWLRFGKGEMFKSIDKKYNDFFDIYNNLNLPLQEFLLDTAKRLRSLQDKL